MSKTSRTINNIKEMLDNVSGLYLDNDIEKLEKYVRAFCNKAEEESNFLQVFDTEDTSKEDKKIVKVDTDWQNVFDIQAQQDFAKITLDKINEIIDVVNQLKKQPPIININGPQSPFMQEPYKITCNTESNGE